MSKRLLTVLLALALVAAACGSDDTDTATQADAPSDETIAEEEDDAMSDASSLSAVDQSGDGTTVTVASVTLATDGFIAIHADNDGAPGAVLGNSELLSAGENIDVVVTLGTALDADATVFPMVHLDVNENGEYEFAPPDVTTDAPATTADGSVAVTGISYTIDEMMDEEMSDASALSAVDQSGDGTTVTVASVTLATDGFIAIHADNDGAPGAVLGNSELLSAGENIDVVVTLGTALDADATVFPMVHLDVNENGEYEFAPPDVTTDAPATTADGSVAVTGISYTIG